MSRLLAAHAAAIVYVCAVTTAHAQLQPLTIRSMSYDDTSDSLAVYRSIRNIPGLLGDSQTAIDHAVDIHPNIVRGALQRLSLEANPRILLDEPQSAMAAKFRRDLIQRAQLVSLASGRVTLQPDQARAPSSLLADAEQVHVPNLPVSTPRLNMAFLALRDYSKIIAPLCPNGKAGVRSDGARECIEGEDWSQDAFLAVVPITVDGKVVCTGTLISQTKLLTAAHCLIEIENSGSRVVFDQKRIGAILADGRVISVGSPHVPPEMLRSCLAPDYECPILAFDFAVIEVNLSPPVAKLKYASPIRVAAGGQMAVTIAGYGVTTMNSSISDRSFFIGTQSLDITAGDTGLRWEYDFATDHKSSICSGDSGGPIFSGKPRNMGDDLKIVGVISRIEPSAAASDSTNPAAKICLKASAFAVNLSAANVANRLCGYLDGLTSFCNP